MDTRRLIQVGLYVSAVVLSLIAILFPTQAGIPIGLVMILGAVVSAVLFPLIYVARHPGSGLKLLTSVGILVALFFICFALSDAREIWGLRQGREEMLAGAELSKWVGAAIYTTIGVLTLTVFAFIVAEIRAALK